MYWFDVPGLDYQGGRARELHSIIISDTVLKNDTVVSKIIHSSQKVYNQLDERVHNDENSQEYEHHHRQCPKSQPGRDKHY